MTTPPETRDWVAWEFHSIPASARPVLYVIGLVRAPPGLAHPYLVPRPPAGAPTLGLDLLLTRVPFSETRPPFQRVGYHEYIHPGQYAAVTIHFEGSVLQSLAVPVIW